MEASEEENPSKSLLESLGAELVSILAPVSACMLIVVVLVRTLSSTSSIFGSFNPSIATFAYAEDPSDSLAHKLEGALLNALAFVAFVTIGTFVLVGLFYFRCTRCLKFYLSLSVFNALIYFGALVGILLIQTYSIPIDVITFAILIANFGVVGVLVVFPSMPVPIVFTQGYLVIIAVIIAFWFTYLPEWTTWALLLGLAAYDVAAVLLPAGPLNLLIQIAMKREEELPALVYECRPAINESNPQQQQQQMRRWRRRSSEPDPVSDSAPPDSSSSTFLSRIFGSGSYQTLNTSEAPAGEATVREEPPPPAEVEVMDESVPLMEARPQTLNSLMGNEERVAEAMHDELSSDIQESSGDEESGEVRRVNSSSEARVESTLQGGLKLGLGDFIFYSLLVGRAAMFDLMTVGACYLAIVAGLGVTLVMLAIWRRALPALPVSISLGVLFYFVTRLVVEPVVLQLDSGLVFF